jgi:hypothetical protein
VNHSPLSHLTDNGESDARVPYEAPAISSLGTLAELTLCPPWKNPTPTVDYDHYTSKW